MSSSVSGSSPSRHLASSHTHSTTLVKHTDDRIFTVTNKHINNPNTRTKDAKAVYTIETYEDVTSFPKIYTKKEIKLPPRRTDLDEKQQLLIRQNYQRIFSNLQTNSQNKENVSKSEDDIVRMNMGFSSETLLKVLEIAITTDLDFVDLSENNRIIFIGKPEERIKGKVKLVVDHIKNVLIGEGVFGVVFAVTDLHGEDKLVIKKAKKEEDVRKHSANQLKNEHTILRLLSEKAGKTDIEGIQRPPLKVVNLSENQGESGALAISYRYECSLSSIHSKQARSPGFMMQGFRQLISGLVYLHSNQIVHSDIKEDNISWNGKEMKLEDFGSACSLENMTVNEMKKRKHGMTTKERYLKDDFLKTGEALETEDKELYGAVQKAHDIYSLGLAFLMSMINVDPQSPFINIGKNERMHLGNRKIMLNGEALSNDEIVSLIKDKGYPEEIATMILGMIHKEYDHRLTAVQCLDIIQNIHLKLQMS